MIFTLSCVKYFFTEEEKQQYELIGFKFEQRKNPEDYHQYNIDAHAELPTIIFHDMDVLKAWVEGFVQSPIIIDFKKMKITIYDDWRE